MAKITLPTISSGYATTTQLNNAFDSLETELQDKVLYRDNPSGEPNTMENDLDMNSNSILNVDDLECTTISVGGTSLTSQVAAAAASATSAANSATAASNSATSSASSAASAATSYDNFDDRYLGQKSSAPSVDNDGSALITGALYFNTSDSTMYVWDSSSWISVSNTTTSTLAADWAKKTTGQVASTDYSSKAWAIGGTGVTSTASNGAAKEWATKTSGQVDTSEYSAKEYAVGTQIRGTTGSSKDWASYTSATVDGTNYSAKYHATAAASSASTATTQASNALTSANNASTSASNAASAQTAAESARDATLSAYDSFDDRYLGSKTSDPSVDNDGNALVGGALYFSSTDNAMKVYTGSAWVAAYVSGAGTLLAANNLSDLSSNATARTNLGLGTAATTAATAYATAAQGTNADTAYADRLKWDGGATGLTAATGRTSLGLGTLATISPTGTASASTFLRGDNAWTTVSVTPTAVSDQANSSTGYFDLPAGTTAQRPGTPTSGNMRYNSDNNGFEGYNGTAWGSIGGASASGAIYENTVTISANYTLTTSTNGLSVGPITIASGAAVTIPSGQRWLVL